MDITLNQIVYALVFISILFAVEGIYLFIRGADTRDQAVNRRMKVAKKHDTTVLNPSIMRKTISGGSLSSMILGALPKLDQLLWAADAKITPAQAFGLVGVLGIGLFLFFSLIMSVATLPAAGLAIILGVGVPYLILQIKVGQERKKFSEQLPDAINMIARGLQAGHPVPVALELVAKEMPDPIGSEIGGAIDEINFGLERNVALRSIATRFPDENFKFFLTAIEMQRETGGNLVDVLDNLTKIIRERSNMQKKALAMSAEGRLTAIIVGSLPYLLMGFLLLTNPTFITDVSDEPPFYPLMIGAWFLWLIGMIWIWKMVNIKV